MGQPTFEAVDLLDLHNVPSRVACLPGATRRRRLVSELLQQPLTQCLPDGTGLGHVSTDVLSEDSRLRVAAAHRLEDLCAER